MLPSSVVGLSIGGCLLIAALFIRMLPIKSKWFFTLFTEEQKIEANRYLSRMLALFGFAFCVVAVLPQIFDFRGLRGETFFILAILTLRIAWSLAKRHVRQVYQ